MKNETRKPLALLLAVLMIISCSAAALAADPIDYDGDTVKFITDEAVPVEFNDLAPQDGSTWRVENDNVVIHIVPTDTAAYNGIHWGAIDDAVLTKDVIFNADGTFDITLPKANCGKALPVAPIKADDSGTTSTQYYLAIPAESKMDVITDFTVTNSSSPLAVGAAKRTVNETADTDILTLTMPDATYSTVVYPTAIATATVGINAANEFEIPISASSFPEDTAANLTFITSVSGTESYNITLNRAAKTAEINNANAGIILVPTNNSPDFSVISASLITVGASKSLVFSLDGTEYEHVFKGVYEDAVMNGNVRTNWIDGVLNAAGKWEFTLPIADGETTVYITAISKTKLAEYDAGTVTNLSTVFFPYQLALDTTANTIVTGDCEQDIIVTVSSSAPLLQVISAATMHVTGGPNSDNFGIILNLKLADEIFSSIIYPTVTGGDVGTEKATSTNGVFVLNMTNAPGKVAFKDKEEINVTFSSGNAGASVTYKMKIDILSRTVTFAGGTPAGGGSGGQPGNTPPTTIPTTPTTPTTPGSGDGTVAGFKDVSTEDYFAKPVEWAVENGITEGIAEGQFGPGLTCTRGQIVTFIWRAMGKPEPKGDMSFTDVKEGDYYYEAVLWAAEAGITSGVGGNLFDPAAGCTRQQVVTFLWRAVNMPLVGKSSFTDVPEDAYYAPAVSWAAENGITTGVSETEFAPDETCIRGQIVTFLYRCFGGNA